MKGEVMKEEIQREIIKQISKNFNIDEKNITPGKDLRNDLGLDSFDAAELAFMVKERYGTEIAQNKIQEIKTVNDVVSYVMSNIKKS